MSFYANAAVRLARDARAPRAGRGEARRALHAGRLARLPRRADGVPVLLQRAVRRAAVDQGIQAAGDLQRPALDRRDDHRGNDGSASRSEPTLHPPPAAARHPDAGRRARRRLPAAVRRAGRSGAGDGRRARRRGDDRAAARASCGSTIRSPCSSATTSAASPRATSARSYITNRPILRDILERFPKTLQLAGAAMLLATIFGVTLGVLSARNPGGSIDRFGLGARVSRDLLPGVLGRPAADPAVRGHAALAAAVRLRRRCAIWSCRRSRSACARSRSSRA